MAKSDFIFISGEAIQEGSHGSHDYTFSSGNPIPDNGEGGYVFESGEAFGTATIIDDYEDQSLSEYGDTNNFSIDSVSALEGDYGLRCSGDSGNSWLASTTRTDITRGMRFGMYVVLDDTDNSEIGILFAVQEDTDDNSNHPWINAEYSAQKTGDPMGIYDLGTADNRILVQNETITKPPSNTLLDFVVTWDDGSFGGSPGDITFAIYEGDYADGNLIDSVTANQSSTVTNGGWGVTNQYRGADVDYWRIIEDRT